MWEAVKVTYSAFNPVLSQFMPLGLPDLKDGRSEGAKHSSTYIDDKLSFYVAAPFGLDPYSGGTRIQILKLNVLKNSSNWSYAGPRLAAVSSTAVMR